MNLIHTFWLHRSCQNVLIFLNLLELLGCGWQDGTELQMETGLNL